MLHSGAEDLKALTIYASNIVLSPIAAKRINAYVYFLIKSNPK